MKVGVIQSNYIPWRGYFDFIASVDLFVFHDDLQYTKGDWRNRNRIKTPTGAQWITVPVRYWKTELLIQETEVEASDRWRRKHINQFCAAYGQAPHLSDAVGLLESGLMGRDTTISALNVRLIRLICAYLGIETRMMMSSDLGVTGSKTPRLINLLTRVGASAYLSGPSARDYLDESMFKAADISLEYKTYDYPAYPQLWGPFDGAVTVLDLIANCGTRSREFITSQTPNEIVVS